MTEIKPMKDAVFKIIFGSSSNTEVLKSLVESVVGRTIEHVEILNPYVDVQTIKNKKTILDVKAKALFQGNREKDDLALLIQGRKLSYIEQIEDVAKDAGLQVSADLKDDLSQKEVESLKGFVRYLFSKTWDSEELKWEIKGFLK